ncbi:MAG: hypothetical protein OXI22_09610 [Defluviicoccus sp.]|nr:hypothetical protein [Defluviicoccus sp.]MDE0384128.1 hypothetical protein [Defluviicoccus sp.]
MRYIAVGLAFGCAWAAIQYLRGETTALPALAGPVLLCGAFGALLWGLRAALIRLAGRRRRP